MSTQSRGRFWRMMVAGVVGVGLLAGPAVAEGPSGAGVPVPRSWTVLCGLVGTVVGSDLQPLVGVDVSLWILSGGWSEESEDWASEAELVESLVTDSDGVYSTSEVLPQYPHVVSFGGGDWFEGFVPGVERFEDAEVFTCTFNGSTVDAGQVVAERVAGLSGEVVDTVGVPVVGLGVEVWSVSDEVDEEASPVAVVVTDSSGQFEVPVLREGEYRVAWSGDGVFVASDVSASDVTVDVVAGEVTALDEALVAVRGGSLSGSVVDPDGDPVAGSRVNVLRLVGSDWVETGAVDTDDVGLFEVPGLLPGSYRVAVQGTDVLLSGMAEVSVGVPALFTVVELGQHDVGVVSLPVGASVQGEVVSDPVGGYRTMMGMTNSGTNTIVADRVWPWALFQKEGRNKQRNQYLMATSIHTMPQALMYHNMTGSEESRSGQYHYYHTLMAKTLTKKLEKVIDDGLRPGVTARSPIVVLGDLNAAYQKKEWNEQDQTSMPKALEDLGYKDLRDLKTDCRKISDHGRSCVRHKTVEAERIIDYIFIKYSGTKSVGKWHTKIDDFWYSDHRMIATDVLLGG